MWADWYLIFITLTFLWQAPIHSLEHEKELYSLIKKKKKKKNKERVNFMDALRLFFVLFYRNRVS